MQVYRPLVCSHTIRLVEEWPEGPSELPGGLLGLLLELEVSVGLIVQLCVGHQLLHAGEALEVSVGLIVQLCVGHQLLHAGEALCAASRGAVKEFPFHGLCGLQVTV